MDIPLTEIIFFIILIIITGFLAAAEISIASFGENKIEELKERKDKAAALFEKIQKNPELFFGTLQTTSTLGLIAASMLFFHITTIRIAPEIFEPDSTYSLIVIFLLSSFIVAFIILIFGLLIPKALGFKYAENLGRFSIRIILPLTALFSLPVKFIAWLSNLFLIPFGEKTNFLRTRFSEDEIRLILSEGLKSGALDETEHEIIQNVFEFIDLKANEVMIPRTEMVAIDLGETDETNVKKIISSGHSLIPVYEGSVDNITGVIHTKDIMKNITVNKPVVIKNLMRPAYFIPESKLISEILREMQKQGERLAIVTDEYGGTEGIITMEDILEEIVGELGHDERITEYTLLPDGKYYVLGSMSIDEFNEIFNHDLPESDEYNTIAGFIAEQTGKILNIGESFEFEGIKFELIKKIRQKMVQFRVYSEDGHFGESDKRKKNEK
ncbi:MAG: hemolysin family protein [Ignavibacteriaceae bacterium]